MPDNVVGQGMVLCLGFKSSVYSRKLDNSVVLKTKKLVKTQNRPMSYMLLSYMLRHLFTYKMKWVNLIIDYQNTNLQYT